MYQLKVHQDAVRAFITVILPKKRSNSQSAYWYCDPSFLVLRRSNDNSRNIEWYCEACILSGVTRDNHCEILLMPNHLYYCIPFSFLANQLGNRNFPFRIAVYSSDSVNVERLDNNATYSTAAVALLHKELLTREPKLLYPVAHSCLLACVHGEGCLYFLAVNGNEDHFLSIKLIIGEQDGLLFSYGKPDETYDIAPRRQKLLAVVSRNGKQTSTSTDLHFRYMSSVVAVSKRNDSNEENIRDDSKLCQSINLTLVGDLMTSNMVNKIEMMKSDNIDIFMWIPQLGSSLSVN